MTRLLVMASGDHHWDEDSRFQECIRVHSWMVEQARARKVGLFLSSGDIFERASTANEREAVAEWLTAMAEICPIVIAKGNHDRYFELYLLRRLRTKHSITIEERAAVHRVAGAAIATVAWPDRSRLLAQAASQAAADELVQDALRGILRSLGDELASHAGPRILLGHFMCDGAETSTGQPLLGQPIRVGLQDLALARAHVTLMGHIHKFQIWDCMGAPALYVGSPFRTTFGQLETKSVTLATFDGAELTALEQLETPATRMLQLEDEWGFDEATGRDAWLCGLHGEAQGGVAGAEVRLRLHIPSDKRDMARAAAAQLEAQLFAEGALSVKREDQIITTTRARAPEVARATSAADKIEAYWSAKGFDPGDRRPALLAKAHLLEEEANHAS